MLRNIFTTIRSFHFVLNFRSSGGKGRDMGDPTMNSEKLTKYRTRTGFAFLTMCTLALTSAMPALAGGELRLALDANSEPANLDYQVDPYTATMMINSFMTDPLVVRASDGSFVPGLATAWESSEDAKTVTLTLREGVTFQDGTPFNADAVVYNIERILAPETGSALLASEVGPLGSVEALDAMTVQFNYNEPWVTFFDMASKAPMWSPTAAAASTPSEFDKELIGTGPFQLVEWKPNDYILMESWDGYRGSNDAVALKGPAQVDTVRLQWIAEPAVHGSVVATGEADVSYMIPALSTDQYKNASGVGLLAKGQPGVGLQMIMNVRNQPLSDKRVRQALLYGRDMDQVNDILYDGLYGEADGPLNNIHPCFWEGASDMYSYDPGKAKALLDEAGWVEGSGSLRVAKGVEGVEDGTELSISWTVLHHAAIGEVVQAQLLNIGVGIEVEQVPGPVQLERRNAREFELMYERLRSMDPKILDDIWNSKYDVPGGWNWGGYVDPELNAVLDIVSGDPDFDRRCDAAKKAQEMIMSEALNFPTLAQPSYTAISDNVSGFKLGATGTHFFLHDVSLN